MIATSEVPRTAIRCYSEYGRMQEVLVCRPNPRALEAGGLDPLAHGYRAGTDVDLALEEWDAFASLLRDAGVTVHELGALAGDAAGEPAENLHYTRDLAMVVGETCLLARPLALGRRREAELAGSVLRRLGIDPVPMYETVEFGDVVIAGEGLVVAGCGPRTRPDGLQGLRRVLEPTGWTRWLTVDFTPLAADVRLAHLDLCFNLVGGRLALVYAPLLRAAAALVEGSDEVRGTFGELLAAEGMTTVPLSSGLQEAAAANVLSLGPDRVVAYAEALDAGLGEILAAAGVQPLAVRGSHLLQTGGGPRCLSMPLVRT